MRASFRKHGSLILIQTLVAIGNTTANSFALIYLIREGYDYYACSVFIFVSCIVPVLLLTFASKTVVRNFTASLNTGMVSLVIYYASLMFLDDINILDGWLLVLIPPAMFGIYIVMMWVPYNVLIMHITSVKARGATIGVYFLVWPLITAIGPLIGGALITYYSYDILFGFAILAILSALFYMSGFRVLRKLRERVIIPELVQSVTRGIVQREKSGVDLTGVDRRLSYGLFVEGIIDGIFWLSVPIISFQFATDESELSQYLSLFAVWGAAMTVGLGYLSDRIRNRSMFLRAAGVLTGLSLILAAIAPNVEGYLSGMSAAYFFVAVIPAFLFTMLLDRLERYKKKGVIIREYLLNVGRCVGVLFTIALLLLDFDLASSVIVAGVLATTIALVR